MAQYKLDIDGVVELRREWEFLSSEIPLKKQALEVAVADLEKANAALEVAKKETKALTDKSEADAKAVKNDLDFKQKKLSEYEGTLNVQKRAQDSEKTELEQLRAENQAIIKQLASVRQAADEAKVVLEKDKAEFVALNKKTLAEIDAKVTAISLAEATLEAGQKRLADKEAALDSVNNRIDSEERELNRMRSEALKAKSLNESEAETLAIRKAELDKREQAILPREKALTEKDAKLAERADFLANKEKSILAAKADIINRNSELREKANTAKLTWKDVEI